MTWTKLHAACQHQDVLSIIQLAQSNRDEALDKDAHGWTPLHILCLGNPDEKAVKALLSAYQLAVSCGDVHGDTPLHVVCRSRSANKHHLVKTLLGSCPAAASISNKEGLMPLHTACRHAPDDLGVIELLVDAYPNALVHRTKMGDLVSRKTSGRARSSMVTVKGTDHPVLDPSAGMKSKDSLDLRFDVGMEQQIRDGSYPLHMALSADASVDVLQVLLKRGPDVVLKTNKYGESPLHVALSQRPRSDAAEQVVDLLLRVDSRVAQIREKKHGNIPLHTAAACGCSARVAKLLISSWPESVHEMNASGLIPWDLALQGVSCSQQVLRMLEIGS